MEGTPPPKKKKVITYRHIKCFRNNLASITAVCTWRHHRSVSWTVLFHHYSDDRCHILNPEQPPTFTAVISVITTTTRPDRQQRHSRPLFVCAVHVCVCVCERTFTNCSILLFTNCSGVRIWLPRGMSSSCIWWHDNREGQDEITKKSGSVQI